MPAVSIVLLSRAAQVDPTAVVATFTRLFPAESPISWLDGSADPLEFRSGQVPTFVALVPTPVPGGEAEAAHARSVCALLAGSTPLPPHVAHLVVSTLGEVGNTAAGLTRHTHVVAAVAKAASAIGIYEGGADATHDTGFYVAIATRAPIPAMLWNGVHLSRVGDALHILSLGMAQLELPDLLLVTPAAGAAGALESFFDVLAWVAGRGERLTEGDSLGRDAGEDLVVHYVPSPRDPGVQVARLAVRI